MVEWTPEQIMRARRIYRQGGRVEDVIEMLGTSLTYEAVRKRLIKLGMRFVAVKTNHDGTSTLVMSPPRRRRTAQQQEAL
jgi:phenylalanyl-tRNA synthetase beta subunit